MLPSTPTQVDIRVAPAPRARWCLALRCLLSLRTLQLGLATAYLLWIAIILPLPRLDDWPLLRWDYSYHYAQTAEISSIMQSEGGSWGYSDLFFAGYPIGTSSNLGSKAWTWFVYLLSSLGVPTVVAFNFYVVFWVLATPVLIYHACRWMSLSSAATVVSVILAMLYWWTSSLYWFLHFGLVSFLAAAPLAMFACAALYAYVRGASSGTRVHRHALAWFTLAAAACLWVHALSAIILAIGCGVVYLSAAIGGAGGQRLVLRHHAAIWLAVCLVGAAQWPWLMPYFATRSWYAAAGEHILHSQAQGWDALDLTRFQSLWEMLPLVAGLGGLACLAIYLHRSNRRAAWLLGAFAAVFAGVSFLVETPLHRLFLAGAFFGLYFFWRRGRRTVVLLFSLLPAALLALGYLGTGLPALQPARNVPVAYLWLAVPTAAGLQYLWRAIKQSVQYRPARAGAILCLLLACWPIVSPAHLPAIRQESLYLIEPLSPEAEALIGWLRANTTREGRVLFEDSMEWPARYRVTAGYLAYESGRAFIGGPFPWGGAADYAEGKPFAQQVQALTGQELSRYLDVYNIHWIIVRSSSSRAFFDNQLGLVEPFGRLDDAYMYRVKERGTYFLSGSGKVEVRDHRLELSDLEGTEIVIKYHWTPNLEGSGGVRLERTMVDPDPYGFIKIVAPPEQVTIRVVP
ncbi:MAG: hypothetical protein JXA93_01685 [Anaerolineae bacterium]|nr:hypothetical protein [Anaerolineae bacterium]